MCGTRVAAILTEGLGKLEACGELVVGNEQRTQLRRISARTIERLRAEVCGVLSSAVLTKGPLSRRASVCGKAGCAKNTFRVRCRRNSTARPIPARLENRHAAVLQPELTRAT